MMTIARSQYRNAPGRSPTGHSGARLDRQLAALSKTRLPINAPPRGRNARRRRRIDADQRAQSIYRNSHTAPVAPKSP